MITGTVNSRLEILIDLPVLNSIGQAQDVLDTGFTGSLTLPPIIITSLGLPWRSQGQAVLGNGSVEQFDIYIAMVLWDGISRQILVQAIDTPPLIGMALLSGYDLRARVKAGGDVQIESIP